MRYVLQVVLSNAQHPEYGQATIPFPIPNQNYDSTIWLCVLFRSNGSGGIDVGRPGRSISSATGPSVGENRMRHLKLRTICRGGVHKEIGLNGAAVISCIFKAKKFR